MTACYCGSLRNASVRLIKIYAEALKPAGLRPMQFAMMAEIAQAGVLSLHELGDIFMLDRSSLRYRLRPLSDAGLIKVAADPHDRRERRVELTTEGSARLAEAKCLWDQAQARFEQALGPEAAAALRSNAKIVGSAAFVEAFSST